MSPLDAGRAEHLQVTVTSTQMSPKHPVESAAVLQSVTGTLRQLQPIQRGMNHCHSTATSSTSHLNFAAQRALSDGTGCSSSSHKHSSPLYFDINTCTSIQHLSGTSRSSHPSLLSSEVTNDRAACTEQTRFFLRVFQLNLCLCADISVVCALAETQTTVKQPLTINLPNLIPFFCCFIYLQSGLGATNSRD